MLVDNNNAGATLCIFRATTDSIFIGFVQFPSDDWTISEYKSWERDHIKNAICLTCPYPPQIISHQHITEFHDILEIAKNMAYRYNLDSKAYQDKYDFRDILQRLFQVESNMLTDYIKEIRAYFDTIYRECPKQEKVPEFPKIKYKPNRPDNSV